jgi:hypothetical protein
MKITREDFKEYVELYNNAWERYCGELGDMMNTDFLAELMFPMFEWMERKLGLDEYGDWWDLTELNRRGIPVEWETIQVGENEYDIVNEVKTKDLDLIYDKWIKNKEEE